MKSGRYVPLSPPRRMMRDLVHFAHKSHTAGINATLNVAPLARERRLHRPTIGWAALFVKAVGLVSQRTPELRQIFMPIPWPHLYQHPCSVATIVLERGWHGQSAVFFDQVVRPEELSLKEIDSRIRAMKLLPIESVGGFRRIIRFTRMPQPVRRLFYRFILYASGRMHAKYFGTFNVNSIPAARTQVMQSATPLTLSLFYGYIEANGDVLFQALWDQRVIDGNPIRRMLDELEHTLNNEIVAELRVDLPAGRPVKSNGAIEEPADLPLEGQPRP